MKTQIIPSKVVETVEPHRVNLTNEEYHYVSELLANRAEKAFELQSRANGEWLAKLKHEEKLIDSLISNKFISI